MMTLPPSLGLFQRRLILVGSGLSMVLRIVTTWGTALNTTYTGIRHGPRVIGNGIVLDNSEAIITV